MTGLADSRPGRVLLGLALLGLFAVPACAGLFSRPAETRVVIFHSNDVHGKIDNFAKVAPILEAERKTGADVFFFSACDNFTGDPVIDWADPPGGPMFDLLDRLGLDVLSLGNHEFDYQLGPVRKLAARFPTVSANIDPEPGVLPELKPHVVLKTKQGARLVVFGLIQVEPENRVPSTHPDKVKGLRFSDPLSKVPELKKLRAAGDVLIGLTHIGHEQDLRLAEAMPEIDVIIGGHSHTRVDPAVMAGGVLVAMAGADNRFLGRVDLRLENGRVVEKKGRLIDLTQPLEEDPAVKAMIATYYQNPALARVIARAPVEVAGKDALGSLMTDAIRQTLGLDVAFQNNGGIRLDRLPEEITLRDIYTLDPFGNQVVQFVMTAAEIRSLVKSSWDKRKDIDLQVSGLSYLVRADGQGRVLDVKLSNPDGSPLAEDRTFKVGVSSYIAVSYQFDHRDPGRSLQTTPAEALIRFLESGPDLTVYRDVKRAFKEITGPSPRG